MAEVTYAALENVFNVMRSPSAFCVKLVIPSVRIAKQVTSRTYNSQPLKEMVEDCTETIFICH